jgi:tetratricopeptide (TPR) repeat protein
MTTSESFLAVGDSLYNTGDYEAAIDYYTSAICMSSNSLRIAETKAIHFRSLSRRSEAYISLHSFKLAYNDAHAALALYPNSDNLHDFITSAPGVLPLEIEWVHDLVTTCVVHLFPSFPPVDGHDATI